MKKIMKRLLTGVLTLATLFTTLPVTQVHAADSVYTTTDGKAGTIVKIDNGGSEVKSFEESIMTAGGQTAYCVDINADFQSGYKNRVDAKDRMSADQISDVALNLEYVKQYSKTHSLSSKQVYLLEQCVVWRRLSVHLGWGYNNVRAAYDEVSEKIQSEVYENAKAFAKANKDRYDCGGYIYVGDGQDLGQFWAKLAVGDGKIQKSSSNTAVTKDNDCYSLAGATYGVYSDKGCTKSVATLTTDGNGNTDTVELRAATYYVKETEAPKGFQLDKNTYTLTVKAGETATLKVSDTPKVTDTLVELFKIDMETGNATAQGKAALEGAEFVWKYYDGYYTKENLPSQPTRTWTTKTKAEKGNDNAIHYITRLADSYKVSGDGFYTQNGTVCLPLGTITVEEKAAPNGYLLEGAYMQADGSSEKINGIYVAQVTEDGELAALSGGNQYSVSDKVIRGGVKIQKRDLETKDTKPQGGATLKDTEFTITTLNDNPVLVDGKSYNKNEVVKTIHTGVDGIAATAADTLPYGHYRLDEVTPPEGYLKDGAVSREFDIVNNGEIVDLTDEAHSVYNQIKRGDLEGVKIGDGTHKRLANVPFRITSKTTGESHIIVTDKNGQFSTAADWVSHKQNTNAGKSSEDGIWFGTSEPDDSKGALLYDTYTIEELRCDSNKGMTLIPAFDVVVSRNKTVINLGTLTDDYEPEISIHTTAADKVTGEKSIVAGKSVTIVDTVTLDGLKKGTKYQLKGWQMVKSENAQLLIDGKPVESDYTFIAKKSEMEVEVSYTFNASALGGKDLVTFEELYDLSNPDEPVKVAEHKDIKDDGQTVRIEERIITIHTNAADKATGEKMIVAGKDVTIIDTVTLDGLEKGRKYQLKGWEMVKSENAELIVNGERVENDLAFTATDTKMEIQIAFVNVTIRMYRKWKIKMYIQRICAKLFTEVINVNTALSIQLRILGLNGIKPNFSELARMYGLDRRTVKKYYDGYEGKPAHHNKSSKLDKHLELIKQKLSLKGVNVRAVYEYILDEVDPDIGTYSNFNKYVKAKELKPKKTQKGHPRYETAPGIQAQVDWKEDITIRNRYGENFTFQVFNYKLGYSRYPIFTYRLYKTRQDVIDCLIRSFKLTGGVPKEILFDNMSSVVTFSGGHAIVSSAMKEFAKDFGFQIKRCKARHAYTKGKVEAANKFMDWLMPYEGEFETEEELIEILDKINLKVQQNICQQTCVPPVLLFQNEKEYLQPMPSDKLTESYLSHDRQTTVRKDSMVTYMNRKYSVPAQYIGKPVKLRESDGILYIYFSTDVIAKHRIGEKRLNYTPEHYRQLLAYHMTDPEHITELAEKNLRQMDEFL